MNTSSASIPLGLTVAALLGCVGANTKQLQARAAFDLNCPEDQIVVHEIDSRTRGITGCGQRATYVESCNGPKSQMGVECTWVLNSDSRPDR